MAENLIAVAVGDIIEIPELRIVAVVNQTAPSLGASELFMASGSGEATFGVPGTIGPPVRVIGRMLLSEVAEGTAACFAPRESTEFAATAQSMLGILERQEAQGPAQHPSA